MRSLFIKIFLSFWVAMTLIGTAFTVVHLSSSPTWVHKRKLILISRALRSYGAEATGQLQRDGARGADKLVGSLRRDLGIRIHLFHLGVAKAGASSPPPAIRRLAHQAARQGKVVHAASDHGDCYAVPLDQAGHPGWVIVGELPYKPRLLSYLQPETLPLRILIVFLVSGLVCFLLARAISRPIRSLRHATQKLAGGDLSARVGPAMGRRRDETGELGQDFDRMADRIQALLDAQQRLLRDISHELRSPLARLSVALGLARNKAGPEAGAALDRIEREADRLNELIGQLTTLARLESGADHIEWEPIDLRALVEEVVRDTNFEGQPRNRKVTLVRAGSVVIHGSPELIRRAVENVVRNGLHFTEPHTTVEVSLDPAENEGRPEARIEVRDHGPGIPEEARDQIFEPFFRVAEARDRESGGSGIGLTISQRAVLLHGGRIRATNAADGGLRVTLDLPYNDARMARSGSATA